MAGIISLAFLFAGEQGEKSFFTDPDLWRIINLVIFLLVLIYIFRNKLKLGRMFEDRAVTIQKELEDARQEKEQANRRLDEMDARLGRLDQEVAEIRAEAALEAEKEAQRLREDAAGDAEKIRQMTRREIEGAMKSARAELQAFVAEQSVGLAESYIRREIRPEDNKRILADYVNDLREAGK